MHPVLNESIFNNERALWEKDSDRMSVRNTDLRLDVENVYRIDGMTPRGSNAIDGVLKETATSSKILMLSRHF